MKSWLAGLVVFAVASCGGDDPPTGPPESTHSISLVVTWPLAAHPEVTEAIFVHQAGPACDAAEDACPDHFVADFDSEGVVQAQFDDNCVTGATRNLSYSLEAATYVRAHNTVTGSGCRLPVEWICREGLQDVLIEVPDGMSNLSCEVPGE